MALRVRVRRENGYEGKLLGEGFPLFYNHFAHKRAGLTRWVVHDIVHDVEVRLIQVTSKKR